MYIWAFQGNSSENARKLEKKKKQFRWLLGTSEFRRQKFNFQNSPAGTHTSLEMFIILNKSKSMVRDIQSLTLGVGIAIACSAGAAYYFMQPAGKEERVEGTLSCPCGKVKGKFSAPKSTPTASCHCEDCVEFARWAIVSKNSPVNVSSSF